MAGSRIPGVTAHGEGRAQFGFGGRSQEGDRRCSLRGQSRQAVTETYPLNPNGSPEGITGLTTADGRFTILMEHPERVFRTVQMSWAPDAAGEDSPWMRMFRNARVWVG